MLETVEQARAQSNLKCKGFLVRVTAKVKHNRYLRVLSPNLGMIECIEKRRFAIVDEEKTYAQFISNKNCYWPEYSYADLELFLYKGKYYIKDFTVIYHFQTLSQHLLAYTASQVCNDLLADLVTDKEQAQSLWPFYLHVLYALQSKISESKELSGSKIIGLLAVFILRALAESGYKPDIAAIFHQESASQENYQFSFSAGKLAPAAETDCLYKEQTLLEMQNRVTQQAVSVKFSSLLHYILTCSPAQLTQIELSESLAYKLYDFTKRWLAFNLERTYDSEIALDKLLREQTKLEDLVSALVAKRHSKT